LIEKSNECEQNEQNTSLNLLKLLMLKVVKDAIWCLVSSLFSM
jgi:hypothetical protein